MAQRRYRHDDLVVIIITQIAALAFEKTDDRKGHPVNANSFTNRICFGEQLVRHGFADNGNARRRTNVALRQKPAFGCRDVGHDAILWGRAGRLRRRAASRRNNLHTIADLRGHCADARYLAQDGLTIAFGQTSPITRSWWATAAVGLWHHDRHVRPQGRNLLRHRNLRAIPYGNGQYDREYANHHA